MISLSVRGFCTVVWPAVPIVLPALALISLSTGCSRRSTITPPEPLAGQIVIDAEHSAWLKRYGGSHVFICGPGGPEDFLYRGRRNADGTRQGDQMALIEKLARYGGNSIYMEIVRTHGGDAGEDSTQNPFLDSDPKKGLDERILVQWEEWFTAMDEHGILIYLFFYDDGSSIWETGDRVGQYEERFVKAIVRRFQHHKSLIWLVAEESEERFSTDRVQRLAEIIRDSDAHQHLIGNHHQSGTRFQSWRPGGALNHFAMQLSVTGRGAHQGAIDARRESGGRYQMIFAESTKTPGDAESMRRHAWSTAMGGLMPMLLQMDIAGTPVEALQQCRYLQTFFESTDFYRMTSHDELGKGSTTYVLANPGRSYIIYSEGGEVPPGLTDTPAGTVDIKWLDCRTGRTVTEKRGTATPGERAFFRPAGIGPECAAWIQFPDPLPEAYFPPPESMGGWRKLEHTSELREVGGVDHDKLADLAQWLHDSDERDFSAVVIRNGYLVLEAQRGRGARTDSGRLASVSKAICATVLAIASERSQRGLTPRKFSFDDPAFQFIPWAKPLSDPRKAQITVRQILNHTSGICPEATGAPNDGSWEYVLGHDGDPRTSQLAFDPGTGCGYSTLAFDHLSLICEEVTGLPYDQFAIKYLLEPIGCDRWWFQYFDGEISGRHPTHAIGMPARDLARIAYCMLRKGRWDAEQVIPGWFIEDIAHPNSPHGLREMRWGMDSSTFADGWQLPEGFDHGRMSGRGIPADARGKTGSGGQFIAYVPSLDLVVARHTGSSGDWNYGEFLRRACLAVERN